MLRMTSRLIIAGFVAGAALPNPAAAATCKYWSMKNPTNNWQSIINGMGPGQGKGDRAFRIIVQDQKGNSFSGVGLTDETGQLAGVIDQSKRELSFNIQWPSGTTQKFKGWISEQGAVQLISRTAEQEEADPESWPGGVWYLEVKLTCAPERSAEQSRILGVVGQSSISGALAPPDKFRAMETGGIVGPLYAKWMTGKFDTNFGAMELTAEGGTYASNGGQLFIRSRSGPVMEGVWVENAGARRCSNGQYDGVFRFEFNAGGFTGKYGFCDEDPSDKNKWTGTRKH